MAMHASMHLCKLFERVLFLFFHLLHPVLSAFAGVLMPDVVSRVSERHGTYSALYVNLPLIHLQGSTICISYLHSMLKTKLGRGCFCQTASHYSLASQIKKKKFFDCLL